MNMPRQEHDISAEALRLTEQTRNKDDDITILLTFITHLSTRQTNL